MKNYLFIIVLCMGFQVHAGLSKTKSVVGIITKIEGTRVTVTTQSGEVVIPKQAIPAEKLKAGQTISVMVEDVLPANSK